MLRALLHALEGAPGPRLIDIGGGTGNYALALREQGFSPTVVDIAEAMLARAKAKGLKTVRADATALPFQDETFDAAILVSMLHHVPEWQTTLREAARVLTPAARLAAMGFTRENVEHVGWIGEYFPSAESWMLAQHPTAREALDVLPAARVVPFSFEDVEDGSIGALQRRPELLLDADVRRQTSYFERLADSEPDELEIGLARLRADLAAGRRPDFERAEQRARYGDAVVMAWRKPE